MSQYDSDDSITPYNDNSSPDEDDIDLDAIENGPMQINPAPNSNSNSNDKKRTFSATNNELNTNLSPSKKQKTSHNTENNNNTHWTCELCTYNNPMKNERCSICTSPKPNNNDNNDNKSEEKMIDLSNSNNNGNDNSISKLINGLKNVKINAKNNSNDNNDNTLDSMDGIINKLEGLKFDANANEAVRESGKMNDIINKLSNLDVNNGNNIGDMVSDINREINKFIIELQQSLYWKFKIKNESKKFAAMPCRSNMDRIIRIMTFYHDNHNEEFNIFSYVNDSESDYKYLKDDYDNIISNNIISNNNIITMKKQFGIFVDYISQMFPICSHNKCNIFRRYSDDKHNNEDDDMFDDKVQYFKQIMDILHCYLFHTEHCGIIIINDKINLNKNNNSNNLNYINLKFGGLWYWFYDDLDCKWIPYNKSDQLKLNMGWRNNNKEVMVGVNNKYKVQFKRDSNNIDPFGHQYDCKRNDSWRRAVIYGVRDINGMLNGIMCDKNPM